MFLQGKDIVGGDKVDWLLIPDSTKPAYQWVSYSNGISLFDIRSPFIKHPDH